MQRWGPVTALAHIFPQDFYPFPTNQIRRRWPAETTDPSVSAYVITGDRDQVVGFAATRGLDLLHFGTAVETWGTGLATSAHDEVLARFRTVGVTRVRLRVYEENQRARRFYEKLGWKPTGRRTQASFPPHPVLLVYERDLRATGTTGCRPSAPEQP